jgi:hypothetical protein
VTSASFSDADRDRITALLREHYALGRLDDDELRERVEVVLGARERDEAVTALAGLPPMTLTDAGDGRSGGSGDDAPRSRRARGRHAQATRPNPEWTPTQERFRDPSSGKIMRVWLDPTDNSRHYIPDDVP